jgi:hypothetical protein
MSEKKSKRAGAQLAIYSFTHFWQLYQIQIEVYIYRKPRHFYSTVPGAVKGAGDESFACIFCRIVYQPKAAK